MSMVNRWAKIGIIPLLVLVSIAFVSMSFIKGSNPETKLSDLKFEDPDQNSGCIAPGKKGYLLYYINPKDCRVCVHDLVQWNRLCSIYSEVEFVNINSNPEVPLSEFKTFVDTMGIKGKVFGDSKGKLKNLYNLGQDSCILALDGEQKIRNLIQFDDFEAGKEVRYFHRLLSRMNH